MYNKISLQVVKIYLFIVKITLIRSKKLPNILLIVADDLGWNDVPWNNPDIFAPRIEELARESLILNQSYVQQVCTPSRAALLTGMYPFHLGRQHRALKPLRAGGVPTGFKMLPMLLKEEANYTTHMIGKWHLGYCSWDYTPTRRGFDSFYGTYLGVLDHFTHVRDKYDGYDFHRNDNVAFNASGHYSTHLYSEEAMRIVEKSEENEDPFFLYLPFQAMHAPMQVPENYIKEIRGDSRNPTERTIYLAMLAAVDKAIGNVVDALKRTNQYEDTVIVFTTDNGGSVGHSASNLPLRGTKGTLWEGGTRGVAFVKGVDSEKGDVQVTDGLFHITDWYPTLAAIAGVKEDKLHGLDGFNQEDMIFNAGVSQRNEFVYNIKTVPFRAGYRMGDYKLLWGEHPKGEWFGRNRQGKSLGGKIKWESIQRRLITDKYRVDFEDTDWDLDDDKDEPVGDPVGMFEELSKNSEVHLFDLRKDPEEKRDIADENPNVVNIMKNKIRKAAKTMRKGNFEPMSILGHPFMFGGNFMPGWCLPEK